MSLEPITGIPITGILIKCFFLSYRTDRQVHNVLGKRKAWGIQCSGRKRHLRDIKRYVNGFWLGEKTEKEIQPFSFAGTEYTPELKSRNKFNLARTSARSQGKGRVQGVLEVSSAPLPQHQLLWVFKTLCSSIPNFSTQTTECSFSRISAFPIKGPSDLQTGGEAQASGRLRALRHEKNLILFCSIHILMNSQEVICPRSHS